MKMVMIRFAKHLFIGQFHKKKTKDFLSNSIVLLLLIIYLVLFAEDLLVYASIWDIKCCINVFIS